MVVCSYGALENWGGGELGPLELKREKEVGGRGGGMKGSTDKGRCKLLLECPFSKLVCSGGLKENLPGPPSKEKETFTDIKSDPKLAIQGRH